MRKVILSMMVSTDNFIEGTNKELDSFQDDDEVLKYFEDLLDSVDAIMYGRRSYELMLDYWPKATGTIADKMNKKSKIVFSKTLASVSWNTRVIKDNIAEEITAMKQELGKDLVLYAGAEILSTFRKLNLVDEYRLVVYHVVLGNGTPLFKDVTNTIRLKLLNTRKFNSGVVLLTYQPMK